MYEITARTVGRGRASGGFGAKLVSHATEKPDGGSAAGRFETRCSTRSKIALAFAAAIPLIVTACSGPVSATGRPPPPGVSTTIVEPFSARPAFEAAQIASLKSLSAGALVARLGEPDFTRRDPPAEIWQYRGNSCVLDVFLYPQDGEMKVLHAATRDRNQLRAPEDDCTPFEAKSAANTAP
jgi:hypothetical protein